MYFDNHQKMHEAGLFLADAWGWIWPEMILPIFAVAILLGWWMAMRRLRSLGTAAFKGEGSFWNFALKRAAGLASAGLLGIIILVSVQYFGRERVAQHHDLWAWQVVEAPKMIEGVLFGEVAPEVDTTVVTADSSVQDYYVVGPDEEIPEGYTREQWQEAVNRPVADTRVKHEFGQPHTQPKRGFKSKNIGPPPPNNASILFVGPNSTSSLKEVGVAKVDYRTWIKKGVWFLIRLVLGTGILVHGIWRHRIINVPMEWNINPESTREDKRTKPQKNYYGIIGNIIFHFSLFLVISPTIYLLDMIKIQLFWSVLMLMVMVLFLSNRAGKWPKHGKVKETVILKVSGYWSRFYNLGVKEVEIYPELEEGDSPDDFMPEIVRVGSFWGRVKQVAIVVLALTFLAALFVKVTSALLVFLLACYGLQLAAFYEVHIRGRLVPLINKKPVYSRFWLLGKKYLNNGLNATLLPAFLWRFDLFLVDYSVWEVNKIITDPIPTKGEPKQEAVPAQGDEPAIPAKKAVPGLPIVLVVNPTLQIVDPEVYLEMDASDRTDKRVMPEVVQRRLLNGLRDAGQNFTYEEIKTENVLQFPVRLQDVHTMLGDREVPADIRELVLTDNDHSLVRKYKERARFWVKVHQDDPYKYVKNDHEGVFRSATYFEYQDWVLMTLMGCGLVEVGVIDATNTKAEEAEERLKISELEKKIKENLGTAAGKGEAARIRQVAALMTSEDREMNELAVTILERLTGAEKAGLIFQIVKGLVPDSSGK